MRRDCKFFEGLSLKYGHTMFGPIDSVKFDFTLVESLTNDSSAHVIASHGELLIQMGRVKENAGKYQRDVLYVAFMFLRQNLPFNFFLKPCSFLVAGDPNGRRKLDWGTKGDLDQVLLTDSELPGEKFTLSIPIAPAHVYLSACKYARFSIQLADALVSAHCVDLPSSSSTQQVQHSITLFDDKTNKVLCVTTL